jgi:hypothetical protein
VLGVPELRGSYDAARSGARQKPRPADVPGGSPVPAPGQARRAPLRSWSGLLVVLVLIVALPLLLRAFRNPSALAAVGLVLALAWFGPRVVRYFRK